MSYQKTFNYQFPKNNDQENYFVNHTNQKAYDLTILKNFNHNILMSEFELLFNNKDLFYDYYNLMIDSIKKSNLQKINSDIIIDYLKKSS